MRGNTPLTPVIFAKLIGGGGGGGGGESTIAWKPTVSADGTISWTRTSSTTKPADQNIKGEDGFSPTVTITPIQGGNRVTITDAYGEHKFDVMNGSSGAFVVDTANPCSYNELQNAINTPIVILIKHEGNVYPFVEKWESDESTKRYVNIASIQRQGVDKGAMYFFFEATIGDFDSPMAYSSNFAQPTGKPYTDSVAGNLSNLTTTDKTNLVAAVNEVNGKIGVNMAVGKETWYGTYTDENDVTYQVYSKTIYIPALPATAGITTYEHGVSNIKQILNIYGFTTDGFVLNAPRQNAQDNITIYQASKSETNKTFSIEVGKDRSNKKAYVTMVYAKNN